MKRQFCDRCRADVTNKRSAALSIVPNADVHGNGEVTKQVDLCQDCRAELEHWLAGVRLAGEHAPAAGTRKRKPRVYE
jgi:hypothetical protein